MNNVYFAPNQPKRQIFTNYYCGDFTHVHVQSIHVITSMEFLW